ncbi:MAG TPA: DUF2092 domain-containing protein [Chthonomonadaceae bacterium]|nr:DUF2092 domain-containing protein [Chthonomonadaceae bacterium]
MSIRTAALRRAATSRAPRNRFRPASGVLMLSTLALALARPHTARAAEDAQSILKKMAGAYSAAKTYQGRITIKQAGKTPNGKAVTMTSKQQIKYKQPNRFFVNVSMNLTGVPNAPARNMDRIMVSDGTTVTVYMAANKQYMKQKGVPPLDLSKLLQGLTGVNAPGATLLPPTTVQGHSAYVVQVKPDLSHLPPNLPPAERTKLLASIKPDKFFIDRQNYHLLRMTRSIGGSSMDVELESQVFNAAIPDTAFRFTPPAGAKEFVPPRGPGMVAPGAPGAPGVPGAPPR